MPNLVFNIQDTKRTIQFFSCLEKQRIISLPERSDSVYPQYCVS